jgi:hypothetical protein
VSGSKSHTKQHVSRQAKWSPRSPSPGIGVSSSLGVAGRGIAGRLGLSRKTVNNQVYRLARDNNLHGRDWTHLVVRALRNGFLDPLALDGLDHTSSAAAATRSPGPITASNAQLQSFIPPSRARTRRRR